MSDTVKILKQRISDWIRASDERCIACQELLRQATDLVALSRDAIARSREKSRASRIYCGRWLPAAQKRGLTAA